MGKLSLGLGLGIGYVLGAQAGRARYEQIRQAAAGLMARPEAQQALEKARTAAPAPLRPGLEKLTRSISGPGGQRSGPQGTGAQDVGEPTPPAAGSAARTDDPLPDPLVPPSRST